MNEEGRPAPGRIAVLGGGSFGTALASIAATKGARVRQWMRDAALADEITARHHNSRYLPDIELHESLRASTCMQWVLEDAELVLIAIPSGHFRTVVRQARPWLKADQVLLSTTKGIEESTFSLMSEILVEETPSRHIGVLSGPNLASELAARHVTATVVASDDGYTRAAAQASLSCDYFRVYASNDRYGAELGGALKNIYAIGVGMAAAMGMGANTKSMLITRALAEMSRFAVNLGASPLTFLGLAGVGDLIVTCSSELSRNYRIGFAVGQGVALEDAVASLGQVAEGVNTVRLVHERAEREGIYMPLASGLYHVLFNGVPPSEMGLSLMRSEHSSDVEFTLSRQDAQRDHHTLSKTNQESRS
ncbi:NAD(P)H-dependent glycerol-3-phosphate dehydrogenase [Larsenimonas sp. GH3-8]|uniref:Glycerol-3-phosphate dehydrogenase [NAD(P)+] n=2 Tax=Larsenimonas rhizosphaerae TaxID=2944682 RepID=A0AA41ZEC3_9GAMM|nr:NAD(P)H-dependent glycerol-3-phosphate dehydrogenase [Larsenimonas rhizosphaerae]MCM2130568.1 NAD(P)H-dependent glycerol-3-phosphate dehydrogenase [Larsenimonas rhizosphaerae]MCX2523272.1 NAD(P)H-dependent glycerol-3-phosphate dehydrogenase [Larsenimonas rhizosphaerae]